MSYLPTPAAFLIRVAAAVFLHAAFSAWQVVSLSKAHSTQLEPHLFSQLPSDIIIEALVAFTALIIGVAASAPPLKEISWASEMKTRSTDSEDSRLSFVNVRHRGGILFAE